MKNSDKFRLTKIYLLIIWGYALAVSVNADWKRFMLFSAGMLTIGLTLDYAVRRIES